MKPKHRHNPHYQQQQNAPQHQQQHQYQPGQAQRTFEPDREFQLSTTLRSIQRHDSTVVDIPAKLGFGTVYGWMERGDSGDWTKRFVKDVDTVEGPMFVITRRVKNELVPYLLVLNRKSIYNYQRRIDGDAVEFALPFIVIEPCDPSRTRLAIWYSEVSEAQEAAIALSQACDTPLLAHPDIMARVDALRLPITWDNQREEIEAEIERAMPLIRSCNLPPDTYADTTEAETDGRDGPSHTRLQHSHQTIDGGMPFTETEDEELEQPPEVGVQTGRSIPLDVLFSGAVAGFGNANGEDISLPAAFQPQSHQVQQSTSSHSHSYTQSNLNHGSHGSVSHAHLQSNSNAYVPEPSNGQSQTQSQSISLDVLFGRAAPPPPTQPPLTAPKPTDPPSAGIQLLERLFAQATGTTNTTSLQGDSSRPVNPTPATAFGSSTNSQPPWPLSPEMGGGSGVNGHGHGHGKGKALPSESEMDGSAQLMAMLGLGGGMGGTEAGIVEDRERERREMNGSSGSDQLSPLIEARMRREHQQQQQQQQQQLQLHLQHQQQQQQRKGKGREDPNENYGEERVLWQSEDPQARENRERERLGQGGIGVGTGLEDDIVRLAVEDTILDYGVGQEMEGEVLDRHAFQKKVKGLLQNTAWLDNVYSTYVERASTPGSVGSGRSMGMMSAPTTRGGGRGGSSRRGGGGGGGGKRPMPM
ncbi:hypothetical protein BT69DRAFT_1347116 [Atractiella rhizophila]|nr:hypothetical protein BT69DRAFT_1347116 [Atractiella rhizophila]